MKTNNVHIIRESVIQLLRREGYTVIEAVDKWDRVYSLQYERAKPNTWHTWIIGRYEFEFTKVGEPKITATEAAHEPKPKLVGALIWWLLALGVAGIGLVVGLIN